jgi:hypothetical protein
VSCDHRVPARRTDSRVVCGRRRGATRLGAAALLVCLGLVVAARFAERSAAETFGAARSRALSTLADVYGAGAEGWRSCDAPGCPSGDQDWGDDSLTYTLALSAGAHPPPALRARMLQLAAAAPDYAKACPRLADCGGWSDVPAWDAIALAREYAITGDPTALRKAEAAFAFITASHRFALGACPGVDYQKPDGGTTGLKTLETDANLVKAALLLYQLTSLPDFLWTAEQHYAAIRTVFYDGRYGLYTVYAFDDGTRCVPLPRRFFASVNGDMIWSGLTLGRLTGEATYTSQARLSEQAVVAHLSDARGVFVDQQAENDVVEPLVEAMYVAAQQGDRLARGWILRNAAAALAERTPDGAFGRFFDGPPPMSPVTVWQANGGLALEIVAGALAARTSAPAGGGWTGSALVARQLATLPATFAFHGSGIALYGTLGEHCCEAGHARLLVDGAQLADTTGVWQNKSSVLRSIPGTVLFAWRWPAAGRHTITLLPGVPNLKEGGPFLHIGAVRILRG